MEKVKVTQEQADAIEWQKEEARRAHEKFKRNHQCDLDEQLYALLDLSTEDYMKASFTVGYEVEPEFKVGDWLYGKYTGRVHQVDEDNNLDSLSKNPDLVRHAAPEEIATEKQRRFFAENGRKPWEIRRNDLLKPKNGAVVFDVRDVYGNEIEMKTGGVETLEEIKKHYKVSCFAEDRKDA